jgi:hypothetical protein
MKKDVNGAKERMAAWWDHELIDRPVIAYSYRKLNFKRGVHFDRWGLAQNVDDFTTQQQNFVKHARNRYYGGEFFPNFWPNYGPGIMAAVLGVVPQFKNGTMWFDMPIDISEIVSVLEDAKINDNNEWYSRLVKVTKYLVEKNLGEYWVGLSDLGGVLDILSSFLGPTKLIVNMRRKPDVIDTCRVIILEKLLKVYDDMQAVIDQGQLGCNSWMDVWCPKHYYPIQCDFSAMLSPKWFRRFALPDIVAQAEHMDYAIYHLDGPNELPYVDDLIAEPSITGIQWVPGIGQPAMEADDWFPLYKKIQSAGKNLVIDSSPFGVARLYKHLDARGLYVNTHMGTVIDAKIFRPKFVKGWGNLVANRRFKLTENMMIIDSKAKLNIINKFS